jgi:putative flippase GtrA
LIGDISARGVAVAKATAPRNGLRYQLVRFLAVGALTWMVDTIVFLALKSTALEAKPVTAKVLAVVAATVVSYIFNSQWSFRGCGGRSRSAEIALFVAISALAVLVYGAPLWVSRYVIQLHVPVVSLPLQEAADFVAAQIVGVVGGTAFRWWAFRKFVFRAPPQNWVGAGR